MIVITSDQKEIIRKSLDRNGVESALEITMEETYELGRALSKLYRNDSKFYINLVEEMADVVICCKWLDMIVGADTHTVYNDSYGLLYIMTSVLPTAISNLGDLIQPTNTQLTIDESSIYDTKIHNIQKHLMSAIISIIYLVYDMHKITPSVIKSDVENFIHLKCMRADMKLSNGEKI